MQVWSGLGIIVSPWVVGRFLNDRLAYGLSMAFAVVNGTMLLTLFKETLPKRCASLHQLQPMKLSHFK
eukprot:SAG31_NODE_191_length_20809_cov_64.613761_11_plen_68_part_00